MKKLAYLLIVSQLLLSGGVFAQSSFVVHNIEFQGLQRVSATTVESYLPIKRGQTLQSANTAAVVRALYQTGFFDQVSLSREGDSLIIHVTERPTIGQLKISGNSVIPTDKLTSVMKSLDVSEGRVYNASVLEKIKQSLLSQYYQLGRYSARVDIKTTPMPRNRVMVNIDIAEGLVAKVRGISIIGNKAFSESTLIKEMDLTTTGLTTWITQTDRYSEEKLDASVEKVRSYYLDRGYLKFDVKSAQAQVTPDKKSVYITMVVSEGDLYTVKSIDIAGDFVIPQEEITKLVTVKPGSVFSRKKVLASQKAIMRAYGNKGYMFSTMAIEPQIYEGTHEVSLVFRIKAGKRAYVRQVTFSENIRTNDVVLRREVQQMEASPASTAKLEESKQRLLLLPYIKEADMSVKPVPGVEDQVDVNYKVKEESSAQASLKLGYSQMNGLTLGAGFNQKNIFGSGNTLGINFSQSKYEQFYGLEYSNPYYTEGGISRSFSISSSRITPMPNMSAAYSTNSYQAGVLYGVPIGQEARAFSRFSFGLSYQNLLVNLNPKSFRVSNQVANFVDEHGRHFQEADFKLGLSRDSRDRAIFPTRGSSQSLFLDVYAPLSSGSVAFYTLNYAGRAYQPITDSFILMGKANLGYGNGFAGYSNFPFFKNYFAGGIDTVRGYEGYSLGPQDSLGKAFGGNMLVNGSLALIFPNYISESVRTSFFVDAGNVYTSIDNREFGGQSTNSGPIRYSFGLEVDALTPFGPVELSLARGLFLPGDSPQAFQFSLGANF